MKAYLLSLLMLSTLFAGTYDNLYSLDSTVKSTDQFMDGEFVEIKRFDAIYADTSKEDLNKTFNIIKQYIADNKDIKISVIGHSGNELNLDEAMESSKEISLNIAKKLEENNISKEIITVEHRSSHDLGFTTATEDGIELSNRVMLSVYVIAPKDD